MSKLNTKNKPSIRRVELETHDEFIMKRITVVTEREGNRQCGMI